MIKTIADKFCDTCSKQFPQQSPTGYKDVDELLATCTTCTTCLSKKIIEVCIKESIALDIKKAIKRLHITQTKLADNLNVTRQWVSRVVKGQENLTIETLIAIAEALNCSVKISIKKKTKGEIK